MLGAPGLTNGPLSSLPVGNIADPRELSQILRQLHGYTAEISGLNRLGGTVERLFVPNSNCPANGSFSVGASGYAELISQIRTDGGLVTGDIVLIVQCRESGWFTETAAPTP